MTSLEYTQVDFMLQNANFDAHYCKLCHYISQSNFYKRNHAKRHCLSSPLFNCFESLPEIYHCVDCGFRTECINFLSKHIQQSHHRNAETKELSVSSYICRNCDFETYSLLHWFKHVKADCVDTEIEETANENVENWTLRESDFKEGKMKTNFQTIRWYKCRYCDYKSKHKCNLKHHVIYKHTNSEAIKWHKCDQCQHQFKFKSNLKKHVLYKHTNTENIKLYKCEHCDVKVKYKANLKTHILTQHTKSEDIKWYKCEHCDFKIKQKYSLRYHIFMKHTRSEDIKWYECEQCDFKAKFKESLKSHLLNKHTKAEDIKWLKCDHCDYKSKTKPNLLRHTKNKHPIIKLKGEQPD